MRPLYWDGCAASTSRRDRDRLDLDQKIRMREAAYLDGGAGRQRAEIFHPHADMLEEFVDVGGEGLGPDEIGERRAGRRQGRLQVLADLADLRAHVSFADDLAGLVAGEQAGHEDQLSRDD